MSPNRLKHNADHARLAALSPLSNEFAWRDHLGDHAFSIQPRTCSDPQLETPLNKALNGPHLKTQQWQRTVRTR